MNEPTTRLNLIQRAMQQKKAATAAPQPETASRPSIAAEQSALTAQPKVEIFASAETLSVKASSAHVQLNYAKLRESKITTPTDKNSQTFNEFRAVKRKLLPVALSNRGNHGTQNVIMVTSALPGEGKTFVSMNLAMGLAAENNLDVILVDGDTVMGSIRKYFNGGGDRGLMDLLSAEPPDLDEVLHRCDDLPNLHVLFSGKHSDTAPELLASTRMAALCEKLSKRFTQCVVIVDTPPALATPEPVAIVTHVDHLIMVVGAGRSGRHQVEDALTALSACRSIFMMFNKSPKWLRSNQGSYYYYYGEKPG